jgi:hypothetical protein
VHRARRWAAIPPQPGRGASRRIHRQIRPSDESQSFAGCTARGVMHTHADQEKTRPDQAGERLIFVISSDQTISSGPQWFASIALDAPQHEPSKTQPGQAGGDTSASVHQITSRAGASSSGPGRLRCSFATMHPYRRRGARTGRPVSSHQIIRSDHQMRSQ